VPFKDRETAPWTSRRSDTAFVCLRALPSMADVTRATSSDNRACAAIRCPCDRLGPFKGRADEARRVLDDAGSRWAVPWRPAVPSVPFQLEGEEGEAPHNSPVQDAIVVRMRA